MRERKRGWREGGEERRRVRGGRREGEELVQHGVTSANVLFCFHSSRQLQSTCLR